MTALCNNPLLMSVGFPGHKLIDLKSCALLILTGLQCLQKLAPAQGTKHHREEDPDHENAQDEVSDVESVGPDSADLNEVDELLSLKNSDEDIDPENETEVIIANRQCNDNVHVDEIVACEYGGAAPKKCLPAVSPKLGELLDACGPKKRAYQRDVCQSHDP